MNSNVEFPPPPTTHHTVNSKFILRRNVSKNRPETLPPITIVVERSELANCKIFFGKRQNLSMFQSNIFRAGFVWHSSLTSQLGNLNRKYFLIEKKEIRSVSKEVFDKSSLLELSETDAVDLSKKA